VLSDPVVEDAVCPLEFTARAIAAAVFVPMDQPSVPKSTETATSVPEFVSFLRKQAIVSGTAVTTLCDAAYVDDAKS
jgi:hypothetical protein